MDDALSYSLVQHLLVPLLQSLGLGDLLVHGVAVEDVVVTLTGWTRPDVARGVPEKIDEGPLDPSLDSSCIQRAFFFLFLINKWVEQRDRRVCCGVLLTPAS